MGRRRIAMKRVNDEARDATFSKRRMGIFSKANEVATMCGIAIAIIVFSPAGKLYSFGIPSVKAMINSFSHRKTKSVVSYLASPSNNSNIDILNEEYDTLKEHIKAEEKKGKMLDKFLKEKQLINGKLPVDALNFTDLQKLMGLLEKAHSHLKSFEKDLETSSSLLLLADTPVNDKESSM